MDRVEARFGPIYGGPVKDPRNEARTHAEHVAMNEVKGKPRTEGYPVSNRSAEFKMAWSPDAKFPTGWADGTGMARGRRGA
jgi:hypothetical protein